jgi:hypothetical protein
MPKPSAQNPGLHTLTEERIGALLQCQEVLPPYELDPRLDSPAIRKRIGEVIAKAMDHRISKR